MKCRWAERGGERQRQRERERESERMREMDRASERERKGTPNTHTPGIDTRMLGSNHPRWQRRLCCRLSWPALDRRCCADHEPRAIGSRPLKLSFLMRIRAPLETPSVGRVAPTARA